MRWHHVTGSLTGTFSRTPNLTSLSKPRWTLSCQCSGTWAGVCTATGVASVSTKIRNGGHLSIRGSGCVSQQLKDELRYLSRMYFFRMGRFSSVGGQGKCAGVAGGSVLRGHLQGLSSGPAMPVLIQGSGMGLVTEDKLAVLVLSQDPTAGKLAGTSPRSTQADNDR